MTPFFEDSKIQVVFGGAELTRDRLPDIFPQWTFAFIKQVHGARVIEGRQGQGPEADGHFTSTPGLALVIQTADCAPVMLVGPSRVCALHAGWRGVAAEIISAAVDVFADHPAELAFIGPHILFPSFEIGRDVAAQLLDSAPPGSARGSLIRDHKNPAKCFFDLKHLIALQLKSVFPGVRIVSEDKNTFVDTNYHSFRRGGATAGRQCSFVVLKT